MDTFLALRETSGDRMEAYRLNQDYSTSRYSENRTYRICIGLNDQHEASIGVCGVICFVELQRKEKSKRPQGAFVDELIMCC